jgi:hypothetical protein
MSNGVKVGMTAKFLTNPARDFYCKEYFLDISLRELCVHCGLEIRFSGFSKP